VLQSEEHVDEEVLIVSNREDPLDIIFLNSKLLRVLLDIGCTIKLRSEIILNSVFQSLLDSIDELDE